MPEYAIRNVRLWVSDLARAKSFYCGLLGIQPVAEDIEHGYLLLDTGPTTLLVELESELEEGEASAIGGFKPFSLAVSDIHSTYQVLQQKGVQFDAPPEKQYWGGTLAYFKDPDQNQLTLVQY